MWAASLTVRKGLAFPLTNPSVLFDLFALWQKSMEAVFI